MSAADVIEGRARWAVIEGDNTEILPTLPAKCADHVITDPPYSEHVHAVGRIQNRYRGGDDSFGFDSLSADLRLTSSANFGRICARWCLIFSDMEGAHGWAEDLRACGIDPLRRGVWVKPDAMPQLTGDRPANGCESIVIAHRKGKKRWNGGGLPAVWTHCIARTDRVHTTQKPVDLMCALVSQFTDPDDLILDPFCGSGTTGVACLRLGRRFIGIERLPQYAAIACERLNAESQGLSLRDARAGQTSLFGGTP